MPDITVEQLKSKRKVHCTRTAYQCQIIEPDGQHCRNWSVVTYFTPSETPFQFYGESYDLCEKHALEMGLYLGFYEDENGVKHHTGTPPEPTPTPQWLVELAKKNERENRKV